MEEKKKIVIDHDTCIGCGTCEGVCPEYFKLVDGLAVPTSKEYSEDDMDSIEEAIDSCPVQAISLQTVNAKDINLIDQSVA